MTIVSASRSSAEEIATDTELSLPQMDTIVTVAGKGSDIGDGGAATSAQLNNPGAIAFDAAGNRYVGEGVGNRVRKIDPAGIITTFAGTGGSGFNGDGIPASEAQISAPRGVVVHGGDLYVVEFGGHRVRKISLASGIITNVAGTGGSGSTGDGGPATEAQLNGPGFVVFDATGDLYISEVSGQKIRKVDAASGIITTYAGTGSPGYTGDDGPATEATFLNPNALALDAAGNLYVADVNNHAVRKITRATGLISTAAGNGTAVSGFSGDDGPATEAELYAPRTVTLDAAGNLYIADFNNNRVRKVSTGGIITTFAGTGTRGYSGDDGPALAAQLNGPNTVSFDGEGNLYIAESLGHRVRKIDPLGVITTFAGGGIPVLGDGGPATAAQFNPSGGVAFDAAGSFYFADLNNNRVRKVSLATGAISTIAGTGVTGSLGDGGRAVAAQLNGPFAVAVDRVGAVYIADSTGRRVRRVDPAGTITTVAGIGVSGSSGDGGPATEAKINNPQGVAVDARGHLYISEFAGARVRRVDAVTGVITTVAGGGDHACTADGCRATAVTLDTPQGIAVDLAGNLYIADPSDNRVRKVDPVSGIITAIAGTGVGGFSGDGGLATAARLNAPGDVDVDFSGNVYIADVGNNRIRRVDTSGTITTIAGTGLGGFAGDGGPARSARLRGARGVGFDAADNLYITDGGNSRIRRINLAVLADVEPDSLVGIDRAAGKWVTAFVAFPIGWHASDVDVRSVVLQAVDPDDGAVRHSTRGETLMAKPDVEAPKALFDTDADGVPDLLMLKFDRMAVASWIAGAPRLALRVEGQFRPPGGSPVGTFFSKDTVLEK